MATMKRKLFYMAIYQKATSERNNSKVIYGKYGSRVVRLAVEGEAEVKAHFIQKVPEIVVATGTPRPSIKTALAQHMPTIHIKLW